jgi:hypothetical protein
MKHETTRIRQQGTTVTVPKTPADRIAALRQIVKSKQYAKIDNCMIDLFSASAIINVYDQLNDSNKAMYASKTAPVMAKVAFKIMAKH